MKPRILLTGKNGQVGLELQRFLPQLGEVLPFDRQELHLSKPDDLRRMIRTVRPNLIVNAAAYTAVDQAEKEEAVARSINPDAPAEMAEEPKRLARDFFTIRLITYLTDPRIPLTRKPIPPVLSTCTGRQSSWASKQFLRLACPI